MSKESSGTLLPCPECGAEAIDGDDTETIVEEEFEFGGEPAVRELAAKECPECGEVFAL